jgi:hypothetical protein
MLIYCNDDFIATSSFIIHRVLDYANNIRSIQFLDGMILIRRAKIPRSKGFDRILAGAVELITNFDCGGLTDQWKYETIAGV